MADWARSLQQGFQTGLQFGQAMRDRREREALQEAARLQQEGGGLRAPTPQELAAAQTYTQDIAAQDAATFGPARTLQDGSQELPMEAYAPTAPTQTQQVQAPYTLGGLTQATPFSQQQIQQARTEAMAQAYEQQGNPAEAMRMRSLAQQQELTGLQLGQARRTAERQGTLDTAIAEAMKLPEDQQMPAVLQAYRGVDPVQALSLESTMGNIELNNITRQAKQYEAGLQQSLTKGVDATMKWIDEQEPGFTLARQGNQIIQTNKDGTQQIFARGTEDQLLQQFASRATPATLLDYARLQVTKNYYNNLAAEKAKIDPAVKTQLDYLEAESLAAFKAAAEDSANPSAALAAQRAKFNLFSAYKDAGIKGIDPYRSSGVPAPTQAASGVLKANPLPKEMTPRRLAAWQAEIDRDIGLAEQMYGSTYAAELRAELEKRAPRGLTQPVPPGTPPTGPQTAPAAASTAGLVPQLTQALTQTRPSVGGRTPSRPGGQIPPAPPQTITMGRGSRERPNPEYAAWLERYGSQLGLR
jgi:hypothetical protein